MSKGAPSPIHVVGFSGSLRRNSYNTALLRNAQEMLPEGMTLETVELGALPLYNPDLEVGGAMPEPVQEFRSRLAAADALLIATPEYNYSVTAALKNAIDWASRSPSPLRQKPVAIAGVSTGTLGTVRAQQHLRQMLLHSDAYTLNNPQVYVGQARERFDAQGRLVEENSRKFLADLLVALADWTRRLRHG